MLCHPVFKDLTRRQRQELMKKIIIEISCVNGFEYKTNDYEFGFVIIRDRLIFSYLHPDYHYATKYVVGSEVCRVVDTKSQWVSYWESFKL